MSRYRLLEVGEVFERSRTFTHEDVRAFADLTGDHGRHHVEPDGRGRLITHGLLTLSLSTEIGGELDFLIQDLELEFLRPVYTGDTVHFRGVVEEVVTHKTRDRITFSLAFENQHGKPVLRGTARGLIRHPRGA